MEDQNSAAPEKARIDLLEMLEERGYLFVTPTPATHAIVLARDPDAQAGDLRDILGWNLPFEEDTVDADFLRCLRAAGFVEGPPHRLRATVRVSSLDNRLFLHSSFPTTERDAVFFGPDSYRFADLIAAELPQPCRPGATIVDIGTGAGVGAIVATLRNPDARVIATDINPAALALARVNAATASVSIDFRHGDILGDIERPIDVALANPPYIVDGEGRTYRDGGGAHGAALSVRMVEEVLPRLAPGGRFILYTGSAVVNGKDRFLEAAARLADDHRCQLRYREIDPDVFGEELLQPGYVEVDRIAAVAAIFINIRGAL